MSQVSIKVPKGFKDPATGERISGGTRMVEESQAKAWQAAGLVTILEAPATDSTTVVADALPHPDFRPGIWQKGEAPGWVKEVKANARHAMKEAAKHGETAVDTPAVVEVKTTEAPAKEAAKEPAKEAAKEAKV